jgi:sigma-B regulation protein RsbU (phosphoserine phosphatase)
LDYLARSSTVVPLPLGGLMVLYTDGLIERRGESLDEGMERLRHVLETGRADSAEGACRQLTRAMVEDGVQDDVAIVAVRRLEEEVEEGI